MRRVSLTLLSRRCYRAVTSSSRQGGVSVTLRALRRYDRPEKAGDIVNFAAGCDCDHSARAEPPRKFGRNTLFPCAFRV